MNETLLEQHSHDESYHTPHLPDMVIYPRDTAEVRAVMGYANEHGIPVIPFGLGSRQDASSRQTALVLNARKRRRRPNNKSSLYSGNT
ncbi:FAD-binding oxidoreductase [Peribacillus sp. NPDC096448]|uniref:FAD-binding oxidoreductase n=1 Tax=Peribacillus sp. NPDC096448 TaxID=3364395 RepID=UPI003817C35F